MRVCVEVNYGKESESMKKNWKTNQSKSDEFMRMKVDVKMFRF